MEFGKLPDVSGVDFSLPPDDPANAETLRPYKERHGEEPPRVYVGLPSWGAKDYVGKIYPRKAKSAEFLRHYARQFGCIEMNTTFYRIPRDELAERWQGMVTEGFRFCPKVNRQISHASDPTRVGEPLANFASALRKFGPNLGASFMQMPPHFDASKLSRLADLLARFPEDLPLAVELRHESWFEDPVQFDEAADLLASMGMATVITDVAGRRDVLHGRLTNGTAMIRLVGNGLHPTDFERVDAWAERLKRWFGMGLREVYFFAHQPEDWQALEFAGYIFKKLNEVCGLNLKPLRFVEETEGKQTSLF